MPVRVVWESVGESLSLYRFTPSEAQEGGGR
jgi:hypothetical protein